MNNRYTYGEAILSAFDYLLDSYPEVFVIGQGLWSPWYVGSSMTDLDKKFGTERIIDTPVSESACTGAAVGAALAGMKPIVVHPRMDFMLYAMDAIVNQAAKWNYMFGGQSNAGVTIRGIINRGGEQGAQHSQALQSWFAHVPGLRVVCPATPQDARDLMIASVLSEDPVLYIDDRWLYEEEAELPPIQESDLSKEGPRLINSGEDLTVVTSGYGLKIAMEACAALKKQNNREVDLIDLRVLNPFNPELIIQSVKKTQRVLVVDGGWKTCGISSEVLASVVESDVNLLSPAKRITLPCSPAPTATVLEDAYYPNSDDVLKEMLALTS